jgi:hypothetical protein
MRARPDIQGQLAAGRGTSTAGSEDAHRRRRAAAGGCALATVGVIYGIEDDVLLVLVINVRHRREAYGR